jgi:hypothetical protein
MNRRLFVVAVTACSMLALAIPTARASMPSGGCPPSFQGPLTFEVLIDMWPPPPDFPDPEGFLASLDSNGDKLLCVMESPEQNPMGPINIIDNHTAT